MNIDETFRDKIIEDINKLKTDIDARKIKFLKLDGLVNVAIKLHQYSNNCEECRKFLYTFDYTLLNAINFTDLVMLRNYFINLKKIVSHLRKKHKLVTHKYIGEYSFVGMSFGTMFCMIIGLIIDNKGAGIGMGSGTTILGMSFGMLFGMLLGSLKDYNAKKNDKFIKL
ncbi:UNVERIFIED_CONTAM: hypothetical protein Cloal_0282 [Acetivibrio alkalicellulosi]